MRFQVGSDGFFRGDIIRAVGAHAVVQRRATRHEALSLGVVCTVDQAHEFVHQVAMKPRRPEGIFSDHPTWREDHEIDVGLPVDRTWRGQHGEDRRVGVIVADRTNGIETPQIVRVRHVVAVPAHHIERRVFQLRRPQFAEKFLHQLHGLVTLFKPGHGR